LKGWECKQCEEGERKGIQTVWVKMKGQENKQRGQNERPEIQMIYDRSYLFLLQLFATGLLLLALILSNI